MSSRHFSPSEHRHRRDQPGYRGSLLDTDNLLLEPIEEALLESMGSLDGGSHLVSMLVVDPRVDQQLVEHVRGLAAESANGVHCGISALAGPGLALRGRETASRQSRSQSASVS